MNQDKIKELIQLTVNIASTPDKAIENAKASTPLAKDLFKTTIAPVAIIATIIALILSIPFGAGSIISNLIATTIMTAVGLGFIAFAAWAFNFLAPKFKGQANFDKAYAGAALPALPYYAATAIAPIPVIGGIAVFVVSIYTIYLNYKFITSLLEIPQESKLIFFIAGIGIEIVVAIIATIILSPILMPAAPM